MKHKVLNENAGSKEMQLAHRMYRRISGWISPSIAKLPLTPNQITVISLLFIIAGSILLGFGEYYKVLAGMILIQIGILLDFVDGDVARIKGMTGIFGNWFDCMLDRIADLAVLIGVITGVALNPSYLMDWLALIGLNKYTLPIVLAIGIVMIGFRFAIDSAYAYTLLYVPESNKIYQSTKKSIIMEFVFSRITFIYFALIFVGIFELLPVYMIALTAYLILWYPALLVALFLKVRKIEA